VSNYFERLAIRGAAEVSVAARAGAAGVPTMENDLSVAGEGASPEPAGRPPMEMVPSGTPPAPPPPVAEPRLPAEVMPEGFSNPYEGVAESSDESESPSQIEQPVPPATVPPIVAPRPVLEAAAARGEETQAEPPEAPSTNVVTVIVPRERIIRVPFEVARVDPAAPAAEAAPPPAPPITIPPSLPSLLSPGPPTPSPVAAAVVEPRASEPAVPVALAESAAGPPEEVSIEVHIGRLELNQPAPPAPPPQRPAPPAYPSGFADYERARNYRDRDWY
jgi:hypothetical protein